MDTKRLKSFIIWIVMARQYNFASSFCCFGILLITKICGSLGVSSFSFNTLLFDRTQSRVRNFHSNTNRTTRLQPILWSDFHGAINLVPGVVLVLNLIEDFILGSLLQSAHFSLHSLLTFTTTWGCHFSESWSYPWLSREFLQIFLEQQQK